MLLSEAATRGILLFFFNIHSKTPVLDSFSKKVAGLNANLLSANGCFCTISHVRLLLIDIQQTFYWCAQVKMNFVLK